MEETIVDNVNQSSGQSKVKKGVLSLNNLSRKQKDLLLSGGSGLAGIAIGATVFSILNFVDDAENPTPPVVANTENPTLAEIKDDSIEITNTEPIHIFTQAKFATTVTGEMPFADAFNAARQELGQGGVFEWHGKLYNTYTKPEWEALSQSDKEQYWASIDNNTETIVEGQLPDGEIVNANQSLSDSVEFVIDETDPYENQNIQDTIETDHQYTETEVVEVVGGFDLNNDGTPDTYLTAPEGEIVDIIMDSNNDGVIDTEITDVNMVTGLTGEEEIQAIEGPTIESLSAVPVYEIEEPTVSPGITEDELENIANDDVNPDMLIPDNFDNGENMDDFNYHGL